MTSIKETVNRVLTENPATRENGNLLIAIVMEEVYGTSNLKAISKMTGCNITESIGRLARKAMENNPSLKPSDPTAEKRRAREARIRKEMRGL